MRLLIAALLAASTCFDSDIKQLCCPSACNVKNSSRWYQADVVLRQCMVAIGCGQTSATVFMKCNCS